MRRSRQDLETKKNVLPGKICIHKYARLYRGLDVKASIARIKIPSNIDRTDPLSDVFERSANADKKQLPIQKTF